MEHVKQKFITELLAKPTELVASVWIIDFESLSSLTMIVSNMLLGVANLLKD